MSESQKMEAGEWYLAFDGDLTERRLQAKSLCYELNLLHPEEELRLETLKDLLPNSLDPWIESPFHCDYGVNIYTGNNFYANHGCIILDSAKVTIGDNVSLSPAVNISTSSYPLDSQRRNAGYEQALPITIGDRVWIGMGAQILAGVTIGADAVVAAGAVVTKDVAANSLVAGVPAKFVRWLSAEAD